MTWRNDRMRELSRKWMKAKSQERAAVAIRRDLEDAMARLFDLPEDKLGVKVLKPTGYKVKITGKISYKVNSDQLQDLAMAADLEPMLTELFRWEPRLDARAWAQADEDVKAKLAGAITAKPGRPGFSITEEEE